MKKIVVLALMIFLVGCSQTNTPVQDETNTQEENIPQETENTDDMPQTVEESSENDTTMDAEINASDSFEGEDSMEDDTMDNETPTSSSEGKAPEAPINEATPSQGTELDDISKAMEEQRDKSKQLDFVGLTEKEAAALAEKNNVPFRVTMRDAVALPVTMDYRPGRINADVESGVVISVNVE